MAGEKKLWNYLLRFLGALILVALLCLLAASLILAKPQKDKTEALPDRPSREASPALSIETGNDLTQLVSAFPAPVMSFLSGSEMTFVSAVSADAAVEGGFARVATLYWQTAEGVPVTLRSIWPADTLNLLEGNFHFMPYTGPTLFGNPSVRMENDDYIRLHVTTSQALYVVLMPRSLSGQVSSICRSLQLFTVGPTSQNEQANK